MLSFWMIRGVPCLGWVIFLCVVMGTLPEQKRQQHRYSVGHRGPPGHGRPAEGRHPHGGQGDKPT